MNEGKSEFYRQRLRYLQYYVSFTLKPALGINASVNYSIPIRNELENPKIQFEFPFYLHTSSLDHLVALCSDSNKKSQKVTKIINQNVSVKKVNNF